MLSPAHTGAAKEDIFREAKYCLEKSSVYNKEPLFVGIIGPISRTVPVKKVNKLCSVLNSGRRTAHCVLPSRSVAVEPSWKRSKAETIKQVSVVFHIHFHV